MKFFRTFHRSVVDPLLYKEVISLSFIRAFKYILILTLLTGLFSGLFQTYYALNKDTGLPVYLAELFKGMQIIDGELDPGREAPFIPNKSYLAHAIDIHFNIEGSYHVLPDSFLVVDTGNVIIPDKNASTLLILRKREYLVNFAGMYTTTFPYSTLKLENLPGEDLKSSISYYLRKHVISYFLTYFIMNLLGIMGTVFFSVLFLSFVTYIFSLQRKSKFIEYIKMSCHAVSPICAGTALSMVANVKMSWLQAVFLFISSFVLLRGVKAITDEPEKDASAE